MKRLFLGTGVSTGLGRAIAEGHVIVGSVRHQRDKIEFETWAKLPMRLSSI
jgi:hypothetical protein